MPSDPNLQELHKPIDIEIVELLLAVIPESWWAVRLDVESVSQPDGDLSYSLSITNPDGEREIVMPPDEIYVKVHEHYEVFRRHAEPWKRLTYTVSYDDDEDDWRFAIDFGY